MSRGTLSLIMGNMFAGKTSELISKIDTMRTHGRKRILILKPTTDTRSGTGKIKNFHGRSLDATEVPSADAAAMLRIVREKEMMYDVIVIDEGQFFTRESHIYTVVDELLRRGHDVIVAGLRLDFRGEPFGAMLDLVGLCDGMHRVTLLHSYCAKCGKPAHLPQRIIDGMPAPYDSAQVQVGGKESYEARCYECHELPGKPPLE